MNYYYTDSEQKLILKSIVILVDKGEQQNDHILFYFDKKKIAYKVRKIQTGDYSFYIPANKDLGFEKNLYFWNEFAIERKNSIGELIGNFVAKDNSRFKKEMYRSLTIKQFEIMIEGEDGYNDMINGNYISNTKPQTAESMFQTNKMRFCCPCVFINKNQSGRYIFRNMYYYLQSWLKNKLYKRR